METLQGYLAWVSTWVGSNKTRVFCNQCFATNPGTIPAPNTTIIYIFFRVSKNGLKLISDGRIHEDHCDKVWNNMEAHGNTKPTGIQCRRGLFETVEAWWQQGNRLVGGQVEDALQQVVSCCVWCFF